MGLSALFWSRFFFWLFFSFFLLWERVIGVVQLCFPRFCYYCFFLFLFFFFFSFWYSPPGVEVEDIAGAVALLAIRLLIFFFFLPSIEKYLDLCWAEFPDGLQSRTPYKAGILISGNETTCS